MDDRDYRMFHLRAFQKDMGQTGKFGEGFALLGLVIALVGLSLLVSGLFGWFPQSRGGMGSANEDWVTTGALFLMQGIGVLVGGTVAMLSGWDRHHHQ